MISVMCVVTTVAGRARSSGNVDGVGGEAREEVPAAGGGDDTVEGGVAFNVLEGGAGADVFVLSKSGFSLLDDFTAGEDLIDVFGIVAGPVNFVSRFQLDVTTAADFFYEESSGALYYNAGGDVGFVAIAMSDGEAINQNSSVSFVPL